jgi:hypothetical protein
MASSLFPLFAGWQNDIEHDPEKWKPVFGKDHAQTKSMIPKSGNRFSEKIMLKQKAGAPL